MTDKTKIIFIGTPEFGETILKGLIEDNFNLVLVITSPDKPVGRKQAIIPPPVKVLAQKYNIPVVQPDKIKNLELKIRNLKPDLGVVAAYGEIIPKNILEIPKYGFLNVHPSLLPKYRGSSPIQNTILNGDENTGVTIMLLDEKMDHGPIVKQEKLQFSISSSQFLDLQNQLAKLGSDLLVKTIPYWIEEKIQAGPQDDSKATYTKIIKKTDGKIDWNSPALYIERQIRAYNPWPGTFTYLDEKIIKIFKAKVLIQEKEKLAKKTGETFLLSNGNIAIQTGKDFLIIEELQLEGKNRTKASDFLRGNQNFIGKVLK